MSISEFFHMGGYAFHVWTAYGFTFVLMMGLVLFPRSRRKKLLRRIRKSIRRSKQA